MDWKSVSGLEIVFAVIFMIILVLFGMAMQKYVSQQPSSFWQGEWKCLEWEGEGLACENWHYPEACEEIEKDLFQECVERVWVERRSVD